MTTIENVTTKREMFTALINLATTGSLTYEVDGETVKVTPDELKNFAENEISQLDKRAAKAKERAAAKREKGDELTEAVYQAVAAGSGEFETIADITKRVEGDDVTTSKVQYRLKTLADAGRIVKGDITIPASEGCKARHLVGYHVAD